MSGVGTVQSWLQAGPVARAAVRWALAQLGDPYRWGATGPDRFDCSGLTSSAYRAAGVSIPRVSRAQWGAGPHVQVANLLPGDLVFYADNPRDPATIHHVGMYIGNGLMVHAPHTGDVVRVASIWRESDAAAHDDVAAHHPVVAGAADDPAADLDRAGCANHHRRDDDHEPADDHNRAPDDHDRGADHHHGFADDRRRGADHHGPADDHLTPLGA